MSRVGPAGVELPPSHRLTLANDTPRSRAICSWDRSSFLRIAVSRAKSSTGQAYALRAQHATSVITIAILSGRLRSFGVECPPIRPSAASLLMNVRLVDGARPAVDLSRLPTADTTSGRIVATRKVSFNCAAACIVPLNCGFGRKLSVLGQFGFRLLPALEARGQEVNSALSDGEITLRTTRTGLRPRSGAPHAGLDWLVTRYRLCRHSPSEAAVCRPCQSRRNL
jgi:hypothetical protein